MFQPKKQLLKGHLQFTTLGFPAPYLSSQHVQNTLAKTSAQHIFTKMQNTSAAARREFFAARLTVFSAKCMRFYIAPPVRLGL